MDISIAPTYLALSYSYCPNCIGNVPEIYINPDPLRIEQVHIAIHHLQLFLGQFDVTISIRDQKFTCRWVRMGRPSCRINTVREYTVGSNGVDGILGCSL